MVDMQWRGGVFSTVDVESLEAIELEARRRGVTRFVIRVLQGGRSGGSLSGGTHLGVGVLDGSVRVTSGGAVFTQAERDIIVEVFRRHGWNATWVRGPGLPGGFSWHFHAVRTDAPGRSQAAIGQQSEVLRGEDGLTGRGKDYHARVPKTTWADSPLNVSKPPPKLLAVTVAGVNAALRAGTRYSDHGLELQRMLRVVGYYLGPLDGKAGMVTQAAIDRWRRARFPSWPKTDYTGPVGITSLTALLEAARKTDPAGNYLPVGK